MEGQAEDKDSLKVWECVECGVVYRLTGNEAPQGFTWSDGHHCHTFTRVIEKSPEERIKELEELVHEGYVLLLDILTVHGLAGDEATEQFFDHCEKTIPKNILRKRA